MSAHSELEGVADAPQREGRWTRVCGNAECRTAWLQLWRGRACPRLEGKWTCSADCMQALVADRVRGCMESWERSPEPRALRMPLGLILLSRGWITRSELQGALSAQRVTGEGQLGDWLRRLFGVSEEAIAKALAAQWNCAVLPTKTPGVESADGNMPAYLRQHYGLVLVSHGGEGLYLAGRSRADFAAARAAESMLGVPVRAAFLEDSAWAEHANRDPDNCEIASPDRDGAAAHIARLIEQIRPRDARLVRLHDHLWLRMWTRRGRRKSFAIRDLIVPLLAEKAMVKAS